MYTMLKGNKKIVYFQLVVLGVLLWNNVTNVLKPLNKSKRSKRVLDAADEDEQMVKSAGGGQED